MTSADSRQTVVVGIDGSAESLAALRWALKEATRREAPAEVVHCYLPQTLTDLGFSSPHELHTSSVMMVDNEVAAALRELPEPPEVRRTSVIGSPAKVLVERAKDASLLVLGVHGRTALRDLVLGRVGSACLRHASCPVVIVDLDQKIVQHDPPKAARVG